ncbi:hypothetical protein ACRALDRAFT_207778 [Sodiomyces alcalophilus JCM 7366]|uniref:uncharacterized protein n=1 Tax=Sodiomyces alcalophilus JCM 7366 TaxID=591952 RepID=UPI0039B5A1B0
MPYIGPRAQATSFPSTALMLGSIGRHKAVWTAPMYSLVTVNSSIIPGAGHGSDVIDRFNPRGHQANRLGQAIPRMNAPWAAKIFRVVPPSSTTLATPGEALTWPWSNVNYGLSQCFRSLRRRQHTKQIDPNLINRETYFRHNVPLGSNPIRVISAAASIPEHPHPVCLSYEQPVLQTIRSYGLGSYAGVLFAYNVRAIVLAALYSTCVFLPHWVARYLRTVWYTVAPQIRAEMSLCSHLPFFPVLALQTIFYNYQFRTRISRRCYRLPSGIITGYELRQRKFSHGYPPGQLLQTAWEAPVPKANLLGQPGGKKRFPRNRSERTTHSLNVICPALGFLHTRKPTRLNNPPPVTRYASSSFRAIMLHRHHGVLLLLRQSLGWVWVVFSNSSDTNRIPAHPQSAVRRFRTASSTSHIVLAFLGSWPPSDELEQCTYVVLPGPGRLNSHVPTMKRIRKYGESKTSLSTYIGDYDNVSLLAPVSGQVSHGHIQTPDFYDIVTHRHNPRRRYVGRIRQHISGSLKHQKKNTFPMCDWEEFLFTCSHSTVRLKAYCHFARNDPNHQSIPCEQCMRWHETSQQPFGQSQLLRAGNHAGRQ